MGVGMEGGRQGRIEAIGARGFKTVAGKQVVKKKATGASR
jgi:hypothetical protein